MRDRYADDGIGGAQLIGEVSRRDGGVCPIHRLAVNTDRVRVFHFECRPFRAMITGVLPCSRSGAQLIGEVSRRDGGVCPIHRLAVNTDRVRVFHYTPMPPLLIVN